MNRIYKIYSALLNNTITYNLNILIYVNKPIYESIIINTWLTHRLM
jgi:hypothetical protein